MRTPKDITIQRILDTLLLNLDIAKKSPYVKKPYSWALYQTWKLIDQFEKEREENENNQN